MTIEHLATLIAAAVAGYGCAWVVTRRVLASPPAALVRTNVNGRAVPAVLGAPIVAAGLIVLAGLAAVAAAGWWPVPAGRIALAAGLVVVVLAGAGLADDLRGDEVDRGFAGHLSALRARRLTGGVGKILAGALAGAGAGLLLYAHDLGSAAATGLLVALTANAINLFDRAPGRAGKVVLALVTPLMALGHVQWSIAVAGAVGALLVCLPVDLAERGMLGDAGANALGGAAGLGLAVSLDNGGRWIAVTLLLALNAASERWSFSEAIRRTPWLDAVDRIGRK
ncbi:MAG: hypothetical protein M3N53_06995 [Actinomycetota bacterium]|nr:hypothetical protein [Actinomycetota bacterium]